MIPREKAEKVLAKVAYFRMNVGPSKAGIAQGVFMPVYFSPNISGVYDYGDNGKVDGYICPAAKKKDIRFIQEMIGYQGNIVIRKP